jgi:Fe-S-cluster containining protein
MSDKENNGDNDSIENSEIKETPKNDSPKKEKFTCVKSFNSCEQRGPIPIVFSDLEFWAKEEVLDNFMGHLRINKNPKGLLELVMVPIKYESNVYEIPKDESSEEKEEANKDVNKEENKEEPPEEESQQDVDKVRCPMFNLQNRECLVYKYRPIACRAYPLEYDGENYLTVDSESPREGEGECGKEERLEMKTSAEKLFTEYDTMRISIPVLFSVVQKEVMPIAEQQALFKLYMENMKAMQEMDEEDRKKIQEIQEIMAKSKTEKEESENAVPESENDNEE